MCQPSALVGLLLALTRANAKEVLMRQEVHRHVVDSHGELHPGIHRMHPDHLLQKDAFQNMAEAESEKNCNSDKTSFKFTFADEFVNVDDVPPADGQPLSAHNKLTSLQRNVTVESSDISKLSPLTLPGQMRSANLFLFDVMVLPHQNMLAIFSLGPKPAAFVNSGPHAEEELNKLTVGLAFHPGKHNLKCGILYPDAIDSNAVGGSIITLCQAPTVDFAEALEQAQRKKKNSSNTTWSRTCACLTTYSVSWTIRIHHSSHFHKLSTKSVQRSASKDKLGHALVWGCASLPC